MFRWARKNNVWLIGSLKIDYIETEACAKISKISLKGPWICLILQFYGGPYDQLFEFLRNFEFFFEDHPWCGDWLGSVIFILGP